MSEGSERLERELKVSELTGAERALAEEAVRIKARLDALDLWIGGDHDTWFELATHWKGEIELVVNAPLVEARQQALALRSILAELLKVQGSQDQPAAAVTSALDEIRARRERKKAEQA